MDAVQALAQPKGLGTARDRARVILTRLVRLAMMALPDFVLRPVFERSDGIFTFGAVLQGRAALTFYLRISAGPELPAHLFKQNIQVQLKTLQ